MEINRWVGAYKVRAFPWVDGERLYFNVLYYRPGQSLEQPPAIDKTVCITNDFLGRKIVFEFTDSLAEYVARMQIAKGTEITLTVESRHKALAQFD